MIDKFLNCNTNSFLAFLDASKAFDKVRHDLIYAKLKKKTGIPVYIIRLIKFWYTAQAIFIRWNGQISDWFRCSNGVKQGGILSPFLFNYYLNDLSIALRGLLLRDTNLVFARDKTRKGEISREPITGRETHREEEKRVMTSPFRALPTIATDNRHEAHVHP